MLRRFLPARYTAPKTTRRRPRLLGFEYLEQREVPSVTLAPINEPSIPNDKPIYVPVTVTNTPAGPVTVAATSSRSNLRAEVLTGGQSVRFDVSGTDSNGVPFTGSLTLRLFPDSAPLAAQRIIDLVNSGYYVGKKFPRIIDHFMIQGGGATTSDNSPLGSFPDQFNAAYTFDSRGLLAMANSGDDTNNSQFFITDTAVPLAQRPTNLNFNYDIVGILTGGFDTYQKIITTPVSNNGSGEVSAPKNPVTITGATVFTDTENAVVKLTPVGGFTPGASANVHVTATDGTGTPATQDFTITGVADGVNSPPFITTPVPDQTTTAGTPVTFTVPVTDIDGSPTTIAVKDTGFGTATIPNATVSIDQTTKRVTITPTAGFTGTIQFKVGVRAASATDTAASYDTQPVMLTVNPAPSTPSNPATGPFTARGSAPGTAPTVTVLNADGSVRFAKTVFDPAFTGGVNVAVGDINGDGKKDVVVTPGFGGGPIILVLDPTTGEVFRTVTLFSDLFRGGLHLKVGDAAGLGYDQVVVGAGETGGPRVNVLDLKQNKLLLNFFAGDPNARGGVDFDLADVFKGKGQMIVAGTGPGAAPAVSLFNATTGLFIGSFAAGDPNDHAGIRVRAGNQDAITGVRPIFVAPLNSPAGTPEQQFDPSKFINPDKPAGATTTATTPSNINLGSLFPGKGR